MAIRICPECNGKVSTTRDDCPHCGFIFSKNKKCPECDEFVSVDSKECPVCGYYFAEPKINKIQEENEKVTITDNNTEIKKEVVEELKEDNSNDITTVDNNIIKEDSVNIFKTDNIIDVGDKKNIVKCTYCNSNDAYQIGKNYYLCMTCRMKFFSFENNVSLKENDENFLLKNVNEEKMVIPNVITAGNVDELANKNDISIEENIADTNCIEENNEKIEEEKLVIPNVITNENNNELLDLNEIKIEENINNADVLKEIDENISLENINEEKNDISNVIATENNEELTNTSKTNIEENVFRMSSSKKEENIKDEIIQPNNQIDESSEESFDSNDKKGKRKSIIIIILLLMLAVIAVIIVVIILNNNKEAKPIGVVTTTETTTTNNTETNYIDKYVVSFYYDENTELTSLRQLVYREGFIRRPTYKEAPAGKKLVGWTKNYKSKELYNFNTPVTDSNSEIRLYAVFENA